MIKFFTKRMNNKKGFTLIELIVVIAILGVLAAIAIPRFTTAQEKSRISADKASARTLISAANVKFAEEGSLATGDLASGLASYVVTWPKVAANTSADTGSALYITNNGTTSAPKLVVYTKSGGEVIYSEDTTTVPTSPYN